MYKSIVVCLAALLLITAPAHAQPLNGTYGGEGSGSDTVGASIHQIAVFKFSANHLTAFVEMLSFTLSTSVTACIYDAAGPGPFAYAQLVLGPNELVGFNSDNGLVTVAFNCLQPSINSRPESLTVVPEKNGNEFSYLEVTDSSAPNVTNPNPSSHLSGHAVIKPDPPAGLILWSLHAR